MNFHVITLFPEMVEQITGHGVLGRAVKKEKIKIRCWNPRDYAKDRHATVDDKPYGGGPGMLMMVQPLADAIEAAKKETKGTSVVVYLSPQGKKLDQQLINDIAESFKEEKTESYILIAGRYEGVDERLLEKYVDVEWSIGDYVLSGGELAAGVVIDAVSRLIPGVLGDEESVQCESFMKGLLDHPHYTRPEEIDGKKVPSVLLGGDHGAISNWRMKQALGKTWLKRPDLLKNLELDTEQKKLLTEYQSELKSIQKEAE